MRVRINKLHFPVTALGLGRRIGIWFQGCTIGCAGCISRDTWSEDEKLMVELSVVLEWCRRHEGERPEGITISGGEPFQQPAALTALLERLAEWRRESGNAFDILCYSGYSFRRLEQDFPEILDKLDAVIPEPFVKGRPSDREWRGSSNQTLIPLSDLGRARYAGGADNKKPGEAGLQVQVQAGKVWFIGVPRQGDMEKLEAACKARGVVPENVSWRA